MILRALIFLSLIFGAFIQPAQARNLVWTDIEHDYSLIFPDTWRYSLATAASGDVERIKVVAPGQGEPNCRVAAQEDRRHVIYPRDYYPLFIQDEVQWPYWNTITAEMEDRFFYFFRPGGVSHADARFTMVDYESQQANQSEPRRALVYAALYDDLQMIINCSAPKETFTSYIADFHDFIGSVHMRPGYAPNYHGYYRDFLERGDDSLHKAKKRTWWQRLTFQKPKPISYERMHRSIP